MRRLRSFILVIFIIVLAGFVGFMAYSYLNSDEDVPEITDSIGTIQVSVNANERDFLRGLKAADNRDGDVTNTIVVASKGKFVRYGVLRVNYAAFDRNNNVGQYSREVEYTDYRSPHFSLTRPLRYPTGQTGVSYLDYLFADDVLDGNITPKIKVTLGDMETVNESVSVRPVNIQVTNSVGDTAAIELPARFEEYAVYASYVPALSNYIMYTPVGVVPDYMNAVQGIFSAGKVKPFDETEYNMDIDVNVDDTMVEYDTPGVYPVIYVLSKIVVSETGVQKREIRGTCEAYLIVEEHSGDAPEAIHRDIPEEETAEQPTE